MCIAGSAAANSKAGLRGRSRDCGLQRAAASAPNASQALHATPCGNGGHEQFAETLITFVACDQPCKRAAPTRACCRWRRRASVAGRRLQARHVKMFALCVPAKAYLLLPCGLLRAQRPLTCALSVLVNCLRLGCSNRVSAALALTNVPSSINEVREAVLSFNYGRYSGPCTVLEESRSLRVHRQCLKESCQGDPRHRRKLRVCIHTRRYCPSSVAKSGHGNTACLARTSPERVAFHCPRSASSADSQASCQLLRSQSAGVKFFAKHLRAKKQTDRLPRYLASLHPRTSFASNRNSTHQMKDKRHD